MSQWEAPIEPERKRIQSISIGGEYGASWPSHAPKHRINDDVYRSISVPAPINKIIDTVAFQRTRNLKQTGLVYRVYPNCEHSRFVHCLGTFSLAYILVDKLRHNQPSLHITSADHLCVSVAALLKNVGHGPFSYLYDGELAKLTGRRLKHEDMSLRIIDRIMYLENVRKEFEPILGTNEQYDQNVTFIKELIGAKPFEFQNSIQFAEIDEDKRAKAAEEEWKTNVSGRETDKSFLFDIVSNSGNTHDVDRMDYLLRDSKVSGVGIQFTTDTLNRIFDHVRVVIDPISGLMRIGYSTKCCADIRSIGDSRQKLHSIVYQHKAVRFMDVVMVQVLIKAGDILEYQGSGGKMYKFSNVTDDVEAFLKTSDFVEQEILNSTSTDERMIEAKNLLIRLNRREIGCKLGSFELCPEKARQNNGIANNEAGADEVVKRVDEKMREILKDSDELNGFNGELVNVEFRVMHSVLGRGLDDETHPIERQLFYEGKPNDEGGVPMTGFYVDEEHVENNCSKMATKWEIFVMGEPKLKDPMNEKLKSEVSRALRLAAEGLNFLTPRKRVSPQSSQENIPDNRNCAAKRRLFARE